MKIQRWFIIFAVLVIGFCFFQPENAVEAQADIYYRFSPTAIYDDGQDSTTLEIYTDGSDVSSVTIKPDMGDQPVLKLFDDGTNGDRAAGDGVYTLGGITTDMFPENVTSTLIWAANGQNADISAVWLNAEITYASGQTEFINYIELKIISSQLASPAEQVGNGLYATEYAFFIVDPVGETYTGSFPNIADYNGQIIAKKFYSVYPDEFDFLNFDVVRGDLSMKAHAGVLQAAAQNIGVDNRNYTAEYGSQGRLLTMVYSGTHGGLLNHEIGHTWGAFVGMEAGISNGVHWNGNTDIYGIMSEGYETSDGLYFFTSNGDGTFKAGWSADTYSPLELYLMGMIPADEVPDVNVLINPDLSDLERVTAERVDTYTIDDIIAYAGGPRQPAYPDAQTHFNLAYILLSDSDFSPAEMAWYTYYARCYMLHERCGDGTFYEATGGHGTVNTRLADWGIPNIQAATPTAQEVAQPTQPPQPTNTSIPSPTTAAEQVEVEAATPATTPAPRPEFKIPICNTLFAPAIIGIVWTYRRYF